MESSKALSGMDIFRSAFCSFEKMRLPFPRDAQSSISSGCVLSDFGDFVSA